MNRTLLAFIIIIASFFMTSCSSYNELLKSSNVDGKYYEGIRLYQNKKYRKALGLFESVTGNLVGTPREDTLLFYMGKSCFNIHDYSMAADAFNAYRSRFTRSAYAEEAEYLYAMCYFHMSAPAEKDQTQTRQAIVAFNEYLNRYPESVQTEYIHTIIEELTQKLYYKTYLNAALYYKLNRYNAAITALRSAIKENPEIPYREEMMYLICRAWYDYAEGSIFARQLDRYMKMTDAYYNFKTSYPDSKQFSKELDKMLDVAQNFTKRYGSQSKEAQQTIDELEKSRTTIEASRDKLFSVEDHAERKSLKETVKVEQANIKKYRTEIKKRNQEYKLEQRLTQDAKPQKASKVGTNPLSVKEKNKKNKIAQEAKTTKNAKTTKSAKSAKEDSVPKQHRIKKNKNTNLL